MRPLWPDIGVIRQRMLGAPASEETAAEHDEPIVDAEALPMPAFVAEQIQRLDDVKYGVRAPAVGDVVLISKPGHSPIAVCLEAPIARNADGARWRGWMVSAETDYATDKDVVLEESDGPCDPLAGMVETWNPLELTVPDSVRVLAHLSEYRMSVLREVACESHADTTELPRPGFIANRETASGRLVLTGTPLGNANDPRAEYQEIFRACAVAYASVSQPAIAPVAKVANQKQERRGFLAGVSGWLMGHRLAAGATALVAVVSGVVVSNMLDKAPTSAPTQVASSEAVSARAPVLLAPVQPTAPQREQKEAEPSSRPVAPELDSAQEKPKASSPTQIASAEPVIQPKPTPSAPREAAPKRTEKTGKESESRQVGSQHEIAQKNVPNLTKPGQAEQQTQVARAPTDLIEIRSLFVPLKDQTIQLAMRSGGDQPNDVKAYRIYLKSGADIDRAVEVLMSQGFRVVKVEEGSVSLQVTISESKLSPELEQKLKSTNLFSASVKAKND